MITLDLTDEQVKYLRGLILVDVSDRAKELRQMDHYGPGMQEQVREALRIGSTLYQLLPKRVTDETHFAQGE